VVTAPSGAGLRTGMLAPGWEAASVPSPAGLRRTRKRGDRIGDVLLYGLNRICIVGRPSDRRRDRVARWRTAPWPAIKVFKLGFLWHNEFNPRDEQVRGRAT